MARADKRRLVGKVAIVSGGGRGIGRCEAMLLAEQGAKVVVSDIGKDPDRKRRADKVAKEIRDAGGEAQPSTDSISTLEGANRTVELAVKSFGGLDILVNNAGLRAAYPIDEITEEQWNLVLDSHLKGTYALIKYAVPIFKRQRSGVIINTGSESGLGHPFNSAYAAAKEGIAGLTRSLARELGRFGIRCNMIRPRAATPGGPEFMEMYQKWMPMAQALGPYWLGERGHVRSGEMKPERVAALVVWLCTDAAREVNGQGFYVAGDEVGLWSEPQLVRCLTRPGGWDLDSLDQSGPENLISDLTNRFLMKDRATKD
ncbi:MAG TPA: SDR family NAD(P)-dependent oxidoreductase [Candidatus Binataceae bacterium]|nr:SDR family NAD(P)-dependent oxidoreductase [Candidatus Binataceae bacterium]